MTSLYDFRDGVLDSVEIEQTSALLRRVYSHAPYLTPAYLKWQYLDNPDGNAVVLNAWDGQQLVGHVAGVPLTANLEGRPARGLFLLNAAVDRDHTGRGIMRTITQSSVEAAERLGYDFCVGMGNSLSTRLFLRDFDRTPAFVLVAPLQARIGYGTPHRHALQTPPSFERLWPDASLRWRLSNPERAYTVRQSGKQVEVIAPTGKPGIGALLHDNLPVDNLDQRQAAGTGPLKVWLGLDPDIIWSKSKFVAIPKRLQPSPLNFVYKGFGDAPKSIDPARAIFRGLDFDPY